MRLPYYRAGQRFCCNFEILDHILSPVSTASASLLFQCLAMFSDSGSSGLGALRRAWILFDTAMENHKCIKISIAIMFLF